MNNLELERETIMRIGGIEVDYEGNVHRTGYATVVSEPDRKGEAIVTVLMNPELQHFEIKEYAGTIAVRIYKDAQHLLDNQSRVDNQAKTIYTTKYNSLINGNDIDRLQKGIK